MQDPVGLEKQPLLYLGGFHALCYGLFHAYGRNPHEYRVAIEDFFAFLLPFDYR